MTKLRPDLGIGDNLRRLRKAAGLKQVDVVAEMQRQGCSISRITYSKMERNAYNIRISELLVLKEMFDAKSFDEFFVGLTYPHPESKS